jgi:endoglucanase
MTGDGEEPHMSRIGRAVVGLVLTVAGVAGVAGPARAAAGAACEVAYRPSQHTGGFTAEIKVKNVGQDDIDGWTFTFPLAATATVVEVWNAELITAGPTVATRDVGYNAKVKAGRSIGIGFRATGTAGDPSWFAVNGLTCRRAT